MKRHLNSSPLSKKTKNTDELAKLKQSNDKFMNMVKEKKEREKRKKERDVLKQLEAQQREDELMKLRQEQLEELHRRKIEDLKQKKQKRREEKDHMHLNKPLPVHVEVPLYMKMQERFKDNVVKPELENQQKILQDIRNHYKATNIDELKKFQEQYEEKMKELKEQKEKERQLALSAVKNQVQLDKLYHAKAADVLAHEDELKRRQLEEQEKHKSELAEKKRNYSNLIRNLFAPKIDPKKKEEVRKKQLLVTTSSISVFFNTIFVLD